mmetsp:Transcript_22522/g.38149  ORF Transcript_22522/g.38149 Transcript_22522/m.38149 type:complete len:239 (-) Transcript_22522:7521-8237(-)
MWLLCPPSMPHPQVPRVGTHMQVHTLRVGDRMSSVAIRIHSKLSWAIQAIVFFYCNSKETKLLNLLQVHLSDYLCLLRKISTTKIQSALVKKSMIRAIGRGLTLLIGRSTKRSMIHAATTTTTRAAVNIIVGEAAGRRGGWTKSATVAPLEKYLMWFALSLSAIWKAQTGPTLCFVTAYFIQHYWSTPVVGTQRMTHLLNWSAFEFGSRLMIALLWIHFHAELYLAITSQAPLERMAV